MVPDWFPAVITVGVAVMALAMVLQLGTLIGLYLAIGRLAQKIEHLLDQRVEPLLASAQSIVSNAQSIVQTARVQVDQLSANMREQVEKVDQVVTEVTDRARLQVIRADEVIADTIDRVERSVDFIERSVIRPVKEVHAVAQGIGSAVDHLRRRRRPEGPERVTQDEEMFI